MFYVYIQPLGLWQTEFLNIIIRISLPTNAPILAFEFWLTATGVQLRQKLANGNWNCETAFLRVRITPFFSFAASPTSTYVHTPSSLLQGRVRGKRLYPSSYIWTFFPPTSAYVWWLCSYLSLRPATFLRLWFTIRLLHPILQLLPLPVPSVPLVISRPHLPPSPFEAWPYPAPGTQPHRT